MHFFVYIFNSNCIPTPQQIGSILNYTILLQENLSIEHELHDKDASIEIIREMGIVV